MCVLWGDGVYTDPLQLMHPAGGEVTVMQQHPGALAEAPLYHLSGPWPLALAQGDALGLSTPHPQVLGKLQQT